LAAADIYKQNQLVTIAPLSSATQLSSYSPYLFRTMPSDRLPAKALGQYMSDRLKKNRAIVFFNSTSTYSQSLKSEFKNALFYNQSDAPTPNQKTAEIIGEVDLSKPDFNPAAALKEAIAKKAEVIVLANGPGDADRALLIMQLNQNRLPILAGDALYSDTVRQVGSASGPGLTLAIPAQQLGLTQSIFHRQAEQLWHHEVTWRTALAYDATLALTQAIHQAAPNAQRPVQREQIREAIARSDFQVMGSVRPIRFTESGDPREAIQLVKLSKNPQSGQPEFMPLNPNSSANSKPK
jgi:ABC-type branched-subunit amino acid transport system substrate-binding protein